MPHSLALCLLCLLSTLCHSRQPFYLPPGLEILFLPSVNIFNVILIFHFMMQFHTLVLVLTSWVFLIRNFSHCLCLSKIFLIFHSPVHISLFHPDWMSVWLQNFQRTGQADPWRAHTKPCAHRDPGERSRDPTRDWAGHARECPGVSDGGVGQQWPASGLGTL